MHKAILWILLLIPFLTIGQSKDAVHKVSWLTLENIGFQKKFIPKYNAFAMFPKFTDKVKALQGKIVEVQGYVIPLEPDAKWVALSAYPKASCFFCGAAGPATVMTIRFKDGKHKFKIDEFRTFRGRLRLNNDDIHEFYYILEEVSLN